MLLRVILILTGAALFVIGVNTGFGGMRTLGMQFPPDMFTVTDPVAFARHDSNARFFGGFFAAGGLVLVLAGIVQREMRGPAIAVLLMMAFAGLFRLVQPDYSPLTDISLLPSVVFEVLLAPLLAFWLYRGGRR